MRRRISVACSRFLRPGANLLPLVVAEIRVLRSAGQDQRIVLERAEVGDDLVSLQMDRRHFSLQDANVCVLREDAADRSGDLGGTQAGRRHLVQQRLKQMMVPPIDERDVDIRRGAKFFGRVQPAESAADDQDPCMALNVSKSRGRFPILSRLVVSTVTRFAVRNWYIVGRGPAARPPVEAIARCKT